MTTRSGGLLHHPTALNPPEPGMPCWAATAHVAGVVDMTVLWADTGRCQGHEPAEVNPGAILGRGEPGFCAF